MIGCDVTPDGGLTDGPEVVFTEPPEAAADVERRSAFLVGFDERLLPASVTRSTVRIESGGVQSFVSLRFDPVDRVIIAAPFFEQPLSPDVTWRLVVEGLRDLDGVAMEDTHVTTFRTGAELGEAYDPPHAAWEDVEPLFERSCTGAGCHGPATPALGLDLSSAAAVRATALGRLSREFPSGATTIEGARGALALSALPIVDVVAGAGRPATSYLVYKVLGDPHILGDAMPPPDAAQPPLTMDEVRTLAAWIVAGAPTE